MASMTLDELVRQLSAAYGDDLTSVVLYGSQAAGENVPHRSDYNVLVLLRRMEYVVSASTSAVARAWADAGNPPPMTMTVEEWRRSSDVFPMEYSDIMERHRILHGKPPFEGIVIARSDLRLQLEQQVMGKLLRLRQGALIAGADAKRQTELMEKSFSTIMVLFRSALRLAGASAPSGHDASIKTMAELSRLDEAPFLRIARHVRGEARISAAESLGVLSQYLAGVERLNAWLDTFPTQEGLS